MTADEMKPNTPPPPKNAANQSKKKAAYEEGPQYDEGDAAKGKLDPEEIAVISSGGPLVAMRDRRAYLLDQAAKNESANDELNARQVEQNRKLSEGIVVTMDPDEMRDTSMDSALAEIDMHTPEYAAKAKQHRQEVLRAQSGKSALKK